VSVIVALCRLWVNRATASELAYPWCHSLVYGDAGTEETEPECGFAEATKAPRKTPSVQ
jgi:hypothetical protein